MSGSWWTKWGGAPRATVKLFCCPHAGGAATFYRPWAAALEPDVDVLAAELPGRGSRWKETPWESLPQLVDALAGELSREVGDGRFAVFGHSFGAFVAFELVRELERRGARTPCRLFVSGARAPWIPDDQPPMHALGRDELLSRLLELGGTPAEVLEHEELLALVLPATRADLKMAECHIHRPGAPLRCPISAFGAKEDSRTTEVSLSAWSTQTSAGFVLEEFAGGHFYLADDDSVLRAIVRDLAE